MGGAAPHTEASTASSRGILAPHTSNSGLLSPSRRRCHHGGGRDLISTDSYFVPGPFRMAIKPRTVLSSRYYYPTVQKRTLSSTEGTRVTLGCIAESQAA